ncbi:unnamed protein product [Brassica rapa subsp. narinosa]
MDSEETKVLIELLVGGIQHGWWDSNGIMNKATVEHKILPVLNERLGCQKTHKHYQNQVLEGGIQITSSYAMTLVNSLMI